MQSHRNNWLDVFAGFRMAFSLKKIFLGTLGVYLTLAVLAGLLYVGSNWWPELRGHLNEMITDPARGLPRFATYCWESGRQIIQDRSSGAGFPWRSAGFVVGALVIVLAIWSFFGGAICRLTAVDFARDESHPLADGCAFAAQRFSSFFWAPVTPFVVALVFLLCAAVTGLVGRIPLIGPPVMGLLFFLALFFGFLALLLLICGFFGFVFCWPTIATEGTNSFDAISRSFNYILARPWKTFWCWLMAVLYGGACVAFAIAFTWATWRFALSAVASGMGRRAFAEVMGVLGSWRVPPVSATAVITGLILKVYWVFIWGLLLGFIASFKLSTMNLIYFVIRREVDGTEMSEVFLPEPSPEQEPKPKAESGEGTSEKAGPQ